jgi:integrase
MPAAEFRAKHLRLVRDEMVRLGWSRRYLNGQVGRVRRMFAWAVAEDLVPESVTGSLINVKGLEAGRSKARERPKVEPIADEVVEATLPHLLPVVADVVRVLRLRGARIGEVLAMTADRIDRSDPRCWSYAPARHKSSPKGKPRTIYFGPRAIEILTPYLLASGGGRVFDYTRDGVRQAIGRAAARAGQPHWHPHQLRHLAATELRARFGLEAA